MKKLALVLAIAFLSGVVLAEPPGGKGERGGKGGADGKGGPNRGGRFGPGGPGGRGGPGGPGGPGGFARRGQSADLGAMFKRLDTDGDGKLSRSEFLKIPMLAGMEQRRPGMADRLFSRLDADKSDSLSPEEFKNFSQGGMRPQRPGQGDGRGPGGRERPGRPDPGKKRDKDGQM